MFGPGRGRTTSLLDIPATSAGTSSAAGLGRQENVGTPSDISRSIPDLNREADLEYGIELLVSGSPIGEGGICNDDLLDYDSDNSSVQQQVAPQRDSGQLTMETYSHTTSSGHATSATSKNIIVTDAMYHQCRNSRLSDRRDNLVSISSDSTFGKQIVTQSATVGSFEDHPGLDKTFHGSHVLKGNVTVNQSLSCSFDPSTLTCLSCKTEHDVIGSVPMSICFSDQNFVPSLSTGDDCVRIVCVENSSLSELLEIAREMFGNITMPEGSVFLFGSTSHLSRYGTSIYARDWTTLVAGVSMTWRGVHTCPLIPLILSECPGSVTREISELSVWFGSVYENNNRGLHETWVPLVEAMENISIGSTKMDNMDTYKVALPSSLVCKDLDSCTTFCTHNSRPITFPGLSKDSCCELLSNLLNHVFAIFRACPSPEKFLARATDTNITSESETIVQRVVLCGASNLKYSAACFNDSSFSYVDNTVPGWTPTPENIAALLERVRVLSADRNSAFIFDLLGNTSVRFGTQLRRDSAGGRTLWPVLPPLPALPPGQTCTHMPD
jgi:hypothetical protein